MLWTHLLAYVTGTVNQELRLRSEYLAAENRILRNQIRGRLLLSDGEKVLNRASNNESVMAWRNGLRSRKQ